MRSGAPTTRSSARRGEPRETGDLRWVVDPLDGTINYLYEIPAFAVSVACEDASGTIAGVVLDPIRDEVFAATRSGEATLNGEPIDAGDRPDSLEMTMVATGFGYDPAWRARQAAVVARVLPRVRDIRRVGAAALDLAWNACGRVDAFYERGLNVWDIAAGALVCSRAGLAVREFPAVWRRSLGGHDGAAGARRRAVRADRQLRSGAHI